MKRILRLAAAYLKQASARLKDSKEALEEGNYPYAVRLSQECVELSLKASLRLVGIEYPKVHDVSDILIEAEERFPEWFRAEIRFMAEASSILSAKREIAFYGSEEDLLAPDELISREEAEEAVRIAERVLNICSKFLSELETKIGSKIKSNSYS